MAPASAAGGDDSGGDDSGSVKTGGGKTGSPRLAELIRARRHQLGMTRQDLADAAAIPYPTVAQIETAYRGVSPARLGILARVLGLDPKELYDVLAADTSGPPEQAPGRVSARSGDLRVGGWYANPGFAAPAVEGADAADPAGPTSDRQTNTVITDVLALLSSLPTHERLDALSRVQRQLLADLVDEQVQRRRDTE
jgi:transcriptional regulator with XRE-family HTH domain